jgi:hypothetical protein
MRILTRVKGQNAQSCLTVTLQVSHMSATSKEVLAETHDAKAKIPTGVELLPLDEAFRNNPYPALELLRSTEPVHRRLAVPQLLTTVAWRAL